MVEAVTIQESDKTLLMMNRKTKTSRQVIMNME